jgi:hypothetical protein
MLSLWMFISFDGKRNGPKKTAGCALFFQGSALAISVVAEQDKTGFYVLR